MIYGYPETPGRVPDGGIGLKGSPAVGHQVRCASLRDGPDTCREAGRTFDARVGNEDDGASRLHLIEVREDFYLKLALVEDITLAGEITLCLGDRGRIRVEGLVAIGGGVAGAPEALLLAPVRKLVAQACYSRHVGKVPRIVTAVLGGDAGLMGAASLGNVI